MKVIKSEQLSEPYFPRFVIVDDDGKVLDDAQGFGYTSPDKAHRAWGWKTNRKQRNKDRGIARWWRKHKAFSEKVNDLYEMNAKDLCSGFVTEADVFNAAKEIASEMGVEGFTKEAFNRFKMS